MPLERFEEKGFEEKGFEETRVADIVKRAETAYGSFSRYFDSRHEVLHEVVRR